MVMNDRHRRLADETIRRTGATACGFVDCTKWTDEHGRATFGRGSVDDEGIWDIPCCLCADAHYASIDARVYGAKRGYMLHYKLDQLQYETNAVELRHAANQLSYEVSSWRMMHYAMHQFAAEGGVLTIVTKSDRWKVEAVLPLREKTGELSEPPTRNSQPLICETSSQIKAIVTQESYAQAVMLAIATVFHQKGENYAWMQWVT